MRRGLVTMTAALKRFRANLRTLGTSLWFQLALLAAYFYVIYAALGLNDAHIGILAGICTGALLPGIADTIGEKIKKRKGQAAEPEVTDAMLNAAVEALRQRYGYLNRTDLQVAILAALRARNENKS
jgi:hypothetical protein